MVIGVGRPVMNNVPFMHLSLAEVSIHLIGLSQSNRLDYDWHGRQMLTSTRIDRPQVHQQVSGHMAGGHQLPQRRGHEPKQIGDAQVPAGAGN